MICQTSSPSAFALRSGSAHYGQCSDDEKGDESERRRGLRLVTYSAVSHAKEAISQKGVKVVYLAASCLGKRMRLKWRYLKEANIRLRPIGRSGAM